MRYPWANTLLLVLILGGAASGIFGLVSGNSDRAIYLHIHRVAAFTILVLLLWKGLVVKQALRRRKRMTPTRWLWMVNALLLIAVLVLGSAWALWGPFYFLGLSGMNWHVYLGVGLVPLMLYHALKQVSGVPLRFWVERRSALRLLGLSTVGFLLWRTTEWGTEVLAFPGAERRFTGSYLRGTRPGNGFPSVSWINDHPQPIDTSAWKFSVSGRVRQPFSTSYDWTASHQENFEAPLDCTGGWYTQQLWEGVSLEKLLQLASVEEDAASVTVTSVTGYYRRFSLQEARSYILAMRVGGETLSHGHGFPLRLVAKGRRGFEWVKWVTSLRVNDTSKYWQPPLPLQ